MATDFSHASGVVQWCHGRVSKFNASSTSRESELGQFQDQLALLALSLQDHTTIVFHRIDSCWLGVRDSSRQANRAFISMTTECVSMLCLVSSDICGLVWFPAATMDSKPRLWLDVAEFGMVLVPTISAECLQTLLYQPSMGVMASGYVFPSPVCVDRSRQC